jgi:hypothetical protein
MIYIDGFVLYSMVYNFYGIYYITLYTLYYNNIWFTLMDLFYTQWYTICIYIIILIEYQLATQWYIGMIFMIDCGSMQALNNL